MKLLSFFSYYGGKFRAAPHYPKPQYKHIIEPFAGAAGYSTRHHTLDITLMDVNPVICGLWDYLINVRAVEILKLPLEIDHVDDLKVCQEAKWLIGFWISRVTTSPRLQPSSRMKSKLRPKSHWGEDIRWRIAKQVQHIRHWKIINASYETAEDTKATWFVDPPYDNKAGRHYPHKFSDYESLGDWCRSRKGQVIVCEQEGADWLPFEPFRTIRTNKYQKTATGKSNEVIWTNDTRCRSFISGF